MSRNLSILCCREILFDITTFVTSCAACVFLKTRFGELERAILLPLHWLITRNLIYGNHAKDFLTNLKMQSQRSLNRQSIDKCTYELYWQGCMCIYIYFLTTRHYACMFPEYDVPVRYNHATIPFEVHAPISFYEKTCGKRSNIIEAISIYIYIYQNCSRYMLVLSPINGGRNKCSNFKFFE